MATHEARVKLIVAGSRGFRDYNLLRDSIVAFLPLEYEAGLLEIVSGCARGADSLAIDFAIAQNLRLHKFPAEWDTLGRGAGFRRNEAMAAFADALIAFWDGESRGTAHMIQVARREKLEVQVVRYDLLAPPTPSELRQNRVE